MRSLKICTAFTHLRPSNSGTLGFYFCGKTAQNYQLLVEWKHCGHRKFQALFDRSKSSERCSLREVGLEVVGTAMGTQIRIRRSHYCLERLYPSYALEISKLRSVSLVYTKIWKAITTTYGSPQPVGSSRFSRDYLTGRFSFHLRSYSFFAAGDNSVRLYRTIIT